MDSVVVHYQEIALKGRNRPWFIDRLVNNLREATADLDVTRVRALMGRIEVTLGPSADWPELRVRLGNVFGVANFARAGTSGRDVDEIAAAILQCIETDPDAAGAAATAGDTTAAGAASRDVPAGSTTFRVRASRADKTYPLTSPEIERQVGGRIRQSLGWRVDLERPDVAIGVEVLPDRIFHTVGKEPGPGGLPTGVSGAVVCLLSGGIDSPVAAYRLMKRGCRVRFVHFHAYPILSRASLDKARELVDLLTRQQLQSRLYAVPFGEIQQQVVLTAPPPLRVVLYRRLMMRIAERIAASCDAKALVTGEAVGQVASQTLDNLAVINDVVTLPVLRPLVGSDKQEIVTEARRLGTYPVSIIPDQDCCTLFVPRRPATRASRAEVERAERDLPIDAMIDRAVAAAERTDVAFPVPRRAESAASSPAAAAGNRAAQGAEGPGSL